jgi:hypothetical protein
MRSERKSLLMIESPREDRKKICDIIGFADMVNSKWRNRLIDWVINYIFELR